MNRRRFIQSLVAAFSMPVPSGLSLSSASAALPAAAAVPKQARFWAIYMSGLHGECTPQTLQNLLHIPESDAKRYVGQLIADGVLKPNPLLQKTASSLLNRDQNTLVEKAKERLDMRSGKAAGKETMAEAPEIPQAHKREAPTPDLDDAKEPEEPTEQFEEAGETLSSDAEACGAAREASVQSGAVDPR